MGTWNVAGRSPVGSLAVDLDEWLNLKDPVDIYVLGYTINYLNLIILCSLSFKFDHFMFVISIYNHEAEVSFDIKFKTYPIPDFKRLFP